MDTMFLSKEINIKKIKKLRKHIKKNNVKMIVISKNLKNNQNFVKNIQLLDIPIVDGRWLFKFLVINILEYIAKKQEKELKDLKITFTIDGYNDIVLYYIKYLIDKIKTLTIVTNNRLKYKKIEEEIFYENGEVLVITNNKRKSLQNTEIIINFNFNSKRLNSFIINEYAIIINLKEKIEIEVKKFKGININNYELNFENRTIEMIEWLSEFEKRDIYESYLYRKIHIEEIIKTINNDKVIIENLIGNNGIICEKEYKKCS